MTHRTAQRLSSALCGVFLAACMSNGAGGAPAQVAVNGWLDDLQRGHLDQAWDALSAEAKDAYPGGFEAFAADATRAQWTGVTWTIDEQPLWMDVAWTVKVTVPGGSQAAPQFLLDRELADRWLVDTDDLGLIFVVDENLNAPILPAP